MLAEPAITDSMLTEVQALLVKLEGLCSQMVMTGPVVMPISADGACRSLQDLRSEQKWTQTDVVTRLRQVANEELPSDLLNQYKRWERGRHEPSRFYAQLLCRVFGVTVITFRRPRRDVVSNAYIELVGQAA